MTDRRMEIMMREELQKKYGALLSITDIMEYYGLGRTTVKRIIVDCRPFGTGTGARYFYREVIEAMMRRY